MESHENYAVTAGSISFTLDDSGGRASVVAGSLTTSSRGRFWSLSVVTGDQRDLPIHSEDQTGVVSERPDGLNVRYERLIAADGTAIEVELTVDITTNGADLEFAARGHAAEGTSVREVMLPTVELSADCASGDEVLYRAEGLGRKIPDPRSRLYRSHTEYMVNDGAGVWESAAYPGELSMPWHGLATGADFLYMGRHDPEFSSVVLSSGVSPRGEEGELWLAAVTPSGRAGFSAGPVVLSLLSGGWQQGATRYRSWADSWYTGPHPMDGPLDGWQRVILRHQYGKIHFRYSDLVDIFEEGKRYGLNGVLVFGWWKAGFDRGYPDYEPDDELGGRTALEDAIREINDRGGFVSLYANGNLIDRTTDYFAEHGKAVAKKDWRGLDHVVGYSFADESRTMRHFSANSFTIACHGAPGWRERMASVAETHASLGAKSVFFDQTAYHMAAWPCYDESHEHGERTGIESASRAKTLAAIRSAADGATVGSEGMADCMVPYLDFHHGWGFAFQNEPEAFPALFRSVYPEPVVTNRLIHDERAGWEDQLNYAFVYNLAFDVSIHRGRRTISSVADYAAKVKALLDVREQHRTFFSTGQFELVDDAPLLHVRYLVDDQALDVYWNQTDEVLESGSATVAPHGVVTVERKMAR